MNLKPTTRLFIWLCIFWGVQNMYCQDARSIEVYYEDSLSYYKSQDDLYGYLKLLDNVALDFIGRNKFGRSVELDSLYSFFREPQTQKEFKAARWAYLAYAANLRISGNIDYASNFYLLAHKYLGGDGSCDDACRYIENELGIYYSIQGDYDRSLYFYKKLLPYYLLTKDSTGLVGTLSNMGKNYHFLSQKKKAYDLFYEAIKYANGDVDLEVAPHKYLTEFYCVDKRLELAEKHFQLLLRGSRSRLAENADKILELHGDIESLKGNFLAAENYYSQVFSSYQDISKNTLARDLAKVLEKRAYNYLDLGNNKAAMRMTKNAFAILLEEPEIKNSKFELPSLNKLPDENTFFGLLDIYAHVHFEKYKSNGDKSELLKAHSAIILCLKLIERIRENYFFDDSKSVKIVLKQNFLDVAMDVLFELSILGETENLIDDIEYVFGQSKSLLLIDDLVIEGDTERMNSLDLKKTVHLKKEIKVLVKEMNLSHDENLIDSLFITISIKKDTLKSVLNRYKTPNEQHSISYIDYAVTNKAVYSLSSINDYKQFIKHGSKGRLDTLFQQMNLEIKNKKVVKDSGSAFSELYSLLIEPIKILDDNLVVIPDGVISFIPFDILKDSNQEYLINNCHVSYAYHKALILRDEIRKLRPLKILTVAPRYDKKTNSNMQFVERGHPYFLKHTQKEINSMVDIFNDELQQIRVNNSDSLFYKLDNATVFHFAGHAKMLSDSAYLFLSDNIKLDYRDVLLESYNLDLVTLSACETGLGQFKYGEGAQSLGRAFLSSGASTIVNSLWTVEDKATAEIMHSFYSNLSDGKAIDASLRDAKLMFLQNASPESSHPYFWGGIVAYGNMNPIIEETQPFLNWITPLVILFFTTLFFVYKLRN